MAQKYLILMFGNYILRDLWLWHRTLIVFNMGMASGRRGFLIHIDRKYGNREILMRISHKEEDWIRIFNATLLLPHGQIVCKMLHWFAGIRSSFYRIVISVKRLYPTTNPWQYFVIKNVKWLAIERHISGLFCHFL